MTWFDGRVPRHGWQFSPLRYAFLVLIGSTIID